MVSHLQKVFPSDNEQQIKLLTHAYSRHFLKQALHRAYDCRKAYYLYTQQGPECDVNCSDVVLFWRIQQVIKVTANALRQQVINREARRLDKEIKEVLDEYGEDDEKKQQLLTGKRVTLAEELSMLNPIKLIISNPSDHLLFVFFSVRVRHIQEKLEEFINALNQEK